MSDVVVTLKTLEEIARMSSNVELKPTKRDLFIYKVGNNLYAVVSVNPNFDLSSDTINMAYVEDIDSEPFCDVESADIANVIFETSPNKIVRAAGSWITDGYKVGHKIVVSNANTPGNDGVYTLTSVLTLSMEVSETTIADAAASTTTISGTDFQHIDDYLLGYSFVRKAIARAVQTLKEEDAQ